MKQKADIRKLKKYISQHSLEGSVRIFYFLANPRPIYGRNSIMLRTLGADFQGPDSYQKDYFDEFKAKKAMTEFAEFCEALRNYDNLQNQDNLVELILEAGDVLFQSIVLDKRHKDNPRYQTAKNKINKALDYVKKELRKRGLSIDTIRKLARVKYGIRTFNISNDLPVKNKSLEKKLCLEELNKLTSLENLKFDNEVAVTSLESLKLNI